MTPRVPGWLLPALGAWTVVPVLILVLRALGRGWPFPRLLPLALLDTGAWSEFADSRLFAALVTSLALAVTIGAASCGFGFGIARAMVGAPLRSRTATMGLALFSVVAPPVALAVGLQVALIALRLNGTVAGVWLAHLVPATGYLTLFAAGVFSAFDFSLHDEARTLGATRWQVLARVTLPLLRPHLAAGVLLGALVSWGQLALTALIGGGVVRTLPVELLAFVRAGDDQLGAAAALVLALPPVLAIGLLHAATRRAGASL